MRGIAYTFAAGINTFAAEAEDAAGEPTSQSTTFEIVVTPAAVGNVIDESSLLLRLPISSRNSLAKLEAAQATHALANFEKDVGQEIENTLTAGADRVHVEATNQPLQGAVGSGGRRSLGGADHLWSQPWLFARVVKNLRVEGDPDTVSSSGTRCLHRSFRRSSYGRPIIKGVEGDVRWEGGVAWHGS